MTMTIEDEEPMSRPTSQSSAGRRRWEMHTRESFETSLAVETPSPASRGRRQPTASKRKVSSTAGDPESIYGSKHSVGEAKTQRVKSSTVRKNSSRSRETSAEANHAKKMADGRKSRVTSASLDRIPVPEKKSSKGMGKITSVHRGSSKESLDESPNSEYSREDSGTMHAAVRKHDCVTPDILSTKLSSILNGATIPSVSRSSSRATYTEDSASKEEGYVSDDDKFPGKIQTVGEIMANQYSDTTIASAPPYEKNMSNKNNESSPHSRKSPKTNRAPKSPINVKSNNKKSKNKRHHSSESQANASAATVKDDSYIGFQLRKLRDDIIETGNVEDGQFGNSVATNFAALPGLIMGNSHAQMVRDDQQQSTVSAIYCEKMHGFVLAKDGSKYLQQGNIKGGSGHSERLQGDTMAPPSRASLAVLMQTSFRTFCVFCQGLLAGVSVAHCLLVFLLGQSWQDVSDTLPPRLCLVYYALILFMTYICFVAACDRCDLCSSSGGLVSHSSLHIPWSAGLYLASLGVTVASTRSEVLLTHRHSPLPSPHQSGGMGWYAWLCLARTSANLLAWMAVVPDPHTDALLNRLNSVLQAEKYPIPSK